MGKFVYYSNNFFWQQLLYKLLEQETEYISRFKEVPRKIFIGQVNIDILGNKFDSAVYMINGKVDIVNAVWN